MKKIITIIALAGTLMLPAASSISQKSNTTYVYICTGSYAKTYHSTSACRGLNACKGSVKKVSLDAAKKQGRSACKICN